MTELVSDVADDLADFGRWLLWRLWLCYLVVLLLKAQNSQVCSRGYRSRTAAIYIYVLDELILW